MTAAVAWSACTEHPGVVQALRIAVEEARGVEMVLEPLEAVLALPQGDALCSTECTASASHHMDTNAYVIGHHWFRMLAVRRVSGGCGSDALMCEIDRYP